MRNNNLKKHISSYNRETTVSCVCGLIISIIGIMLGIKIKVTWAFSLVVLFSALYGLLDTKLTCLSYVVPSIYMIDVILVNLGLKQKMFDIDYVSMIFAIGAFHQIEGLLTCLYSNKNTEAVISYEGTKAVGAYKSQRQWYVPILLFAWERYYVPILVMLLYCNTTKVYKPRHKNILMGIMIMTYGSIDMLMYFLVKNSILALLLAMITVMLMHEVMMIVDTRNERKPSIYTNPRLGLRVLSKQAYLGGMQRNASAPKSTKIEEGDIILKIDGRKVRSETEFDMILDSCKCKKDRIKVEVRKLGGRTVRYNYTYDELVEINMVFVPAV